MSHQGNRLLGADESLVHQIVDTMATVSESDLSWTEKVWASVFAPDGSLQVDVGIGKYPNRNVLDGFAGVSRGREQWTVRASRALAPDPETTAVGPVHYEVLRPLERVRFTLDANEVVPISFEITLAGIMRPFFEDRDRRWDSTGFRVVTDVLRYHQPVSVDGWIEVDGQRHELGGDWVGFRDHSWGVRRNVGVDPPDLRPPSRSLEQTDYRMHWAPLVLRDTDGTWREMHFHLQDTSRSKIYSSGSLNASDGSQTRAWRVRPELRFDQATRRLLGGTVTFDLESDERRVLEIEPMADTGFHLGAALYMDFRGHHHGSWRGNFHLDGEYIEDCTDPKVLLELHQLRDCIVAVREGDSVGWGLVESILTGEWPDAGLSADGSFV